MYLKNLLSGLLILISVSLFAENVQTTQKKQSNINPVDSIQLSIDFLKKYIQPTGVWQSENPEIFKLVKGLIDFAEDEPIDTILIKLGKLQKQKNNRYINRQPEFVSDSLKVPGYVNYPSILEKMKQLDREIWNGVDMKSIPLSESMKEKIASQPKPIAPGDENAILERTGIILPDSLANVNIMPDSTTHKPNNFNLIKKRDQLRTRLLESARVAYNKKINNQLDSTIIAYRKYAVKVFSDSLQNHLRDSLKLKNQQVLTRYNDSIVALVNNTFDKYLKTLQRYAENDSVEISVNSLSGKPTQLWLSNNKRRINRLYIKNEQNDSLAVRIMNLDKHSLGVAIDDDVTFSRLVKQQKRDFTFGEIKPDAKLKKIRKRFDVLTPWEYGGNGTFGFTQTYLNNWKAGGESAFSFLMVLKGYANYSHEKIRWENNGEIRNGWIRQGGEVNQTQKNDDKLELISRLGVSAFDKWFYSAEVDFTTQLFNGYNYPDKSSPISSFLSPAKTLFKLGLDYKPNKNFSLFLSPITAKVVYVRDTAQIDQTRYGISHNSRSLWEAGLNTDVRYKIDITPQISFETKYKMFVNYQDPLEKLDLNWENTLVTQLTNRIGMTINLYMLYDDNVTFPTGKFDADGKEIYKPKLQTKELMTVGFSYKINKHVYRRERVE